MITIITITTTIVYDTDPYTTSNIGCSGSCPSNTLPTNSNNIRTINDPLEETYTSTLEDIKNICPKFVLILFRIESILSLNDTYNDTILSL